MRALFIAAAVGLLGCQAEPNLSSTAQHLTITSPSSTTFAATQVGSTSAPSYFVINPSGYSAQNVTAITESCPDFAVQAGLPQYVAKECINECVAGAGIICPVQVACQGGYELYQGEFSATFTPTVAAAVSCVVTIVSTNGSNTVTLYGTGTPPPLSGYATPGSVNLGDVRVGSPSGAAGITFVNNGGEQLNINSLTAPAAYAISPTSFSLAPGQAQGVSVTCTPGATGQQGGALSIASNFGFPAIPLGCNGILGALDISPSPSAIPTTRVGEPRTASITLRNSGTASMTIASVTFTGTDMQLMAMPPPNTTLNPSATATATIQFDATTTNDATGTLTVVYDGGQTRSTQISAKALDTSMSISPSGTIDLGPVCVGQSADKEFKVIANAAGPFFVNAISSPGDTAAFTVTAPGLPATVQGNAASTYAFRVAAAPLEPGPQATQVTVTTDVPGGAPTTLDVAVTGLPEGVTATPAELYLGAVPAEQNTLGLPVQVTNCGSADVSVTNARIEGVDAFEFSIVVNPDSLTIESTKSAEWIVIASPKTAGEKTATFLVDTADGTTLSIPLTADGIGDQPGPDGEGGDDGVRPSYYACSTGTGTAAWPLAIAIGFVVSRRRRRA